MERRDPREDIAVIFAEWVEPLLEIEDRLGALTEDEWCCLEDGPGPWGWDL